MIRPFNFLAATTLLLTLILPLAARAQSGYFPIARMKMFSHVMIDLQALVNINGFHEDNQFCVVGFLDAGDEPSDAGAYVFWPTENKLIWWQPDGDYPEVSGIPPRDDPANMVRSRDYGDLRYDVAESEASMTPSKIWTRSEANDAIHECWKYGTNYRIKKTRGGFASIKTFPQFSSVDAQLKYLVNPPSYLLNTFPDSAYPAKPVNQFCVIAQQDKNWLAAYVYWKTVRRLYLWLPQPAPYYKNDDGVLFDGFGMLDLKNAPENEEPYDPYTYKMPNDYVINILNACAEKGENITIQNNIVEYDK